LPSQPELLGQARRFADRINSLLNGTITDGIRVGVVLEVDGSVCWIGTGVTHSNFAGRCIPLSIGRRPRAHLLAHYTLSLDRDPRYLLVDQSTYELYLDAEGEHSAFHYDYIREPPATYPAAHFQIHASCRALDEILTASGRAADRVRDLHFPVGGKRYRPSLEDVVEFLVVERLAEPRQGWETVIESHRDEFHRQQLKAAVRNDPDAAREVLESLPPE
jgi:hypothetical protein